MNPPPATIQTPGGWILVDDALTWIMDAKGEMMPLDVLPAFERANEAIKNRSGMVIDVGGYCGDTANFFLKRGREVAVFEPRPDAFWCLMQNCPPSPSCQLYPFALGNQESISFAPQEETQKNLAARYVTVGGDLTTYRLDDFKFTNVALLKIDVEGFEPYVLTGAKETLAREKPFVMIEFNPLQLGKQNFTISDIEKHFPAEQWDRETIFVWFESHGDWLYKPK